MSLLCWHHRRRHSTWNRLPACSILVGCFIITVWLHYISYKTSIEVNHSLTMPSLLSHTAKSTITNHFVFYCIISVYIFIRNRNLFKSILVVQIHSKDYVSLLYLYLALQSYTVVNFLGSITRLANRSWYIIRNNPLVQREVYDSISESVHDISLASRWIRIEDIRDFDATLYYWATAVNIKHAWALFPILQSIKPPIDKRSLCWWYI